MKELTKRQKDVLNFIKQYQKENGISPAIRDIGEYFGFSVKAAYDHLIALQKKKIIFRDSISRNILINNENLNFNLNLSILANYDKLSKTHRIMKTVPKAKICVICGSKKDVHRHHQDYSKPKEYIELCRKHHLIWHVFLGKFKKIGFIVKLIESR